MQDNPKKIPKAHRAVTGDGTVISATSCVVPILEELERGKLRVIGTGFYVTRYGLLLSAGHVFDDVNRLDGPIRIFHDTGEHVHIRHVKRVSIADQADIALVEADNFLSRFPDNPLTNLRANLTLDVPQRGEKLITFAYPRNRFLDFTDEDKDKPIVVFANRFEGAFVCVEEPPKYDKHGIRTYQTTVPIESGASGGPIFDRTGRVIGVARSSMEFQGSEHEGAVTSFVTPLQHGLHLNLSNLLLPEWSWEYRQIPDSQHRGPLTILDLARFGHVEFTPKIV